MKTRYSGFTLIELLISLSLASILIGYGVPNYKRLIQHNQVSVELQQLVALLNTARQSAIVHNRKVTICPSDTNNQCSKSWSGGYLAFIDDNSNRLLDPSEKIIYQFKSQSEAIDIQWRAFGNRKSLQWLPSGITNHQNGTFKICLREQPTEARALIITKAGRIRRSTDSNGDNVHEDARGKNLRCELPT